MMNQYFGSWHGPASALVTSLDKVDRLFPTKMVIISEMGFAGIFAKNPAEADRARVQIMREQFPELARRDWIAGAILWCYQDYKSPRNLWPGLTEGFVDHGVVDENRQRRPSYAVWKELNASASITAQWVGASGGKAPGGFSATVVPRSERDLPYYALRDYQLTWKILDEKGKRLAGAEQQLASACGAGVGVGLTAGLSRRPDVHADPDAATTRRRRCRGAQARVARCCRKLRQAPS